jgi:HNH endonuclease
MIAEDKLEIFANRFWAKVCLGNDDVCWEWTGAISSHKHDQYGKVKLPSSKEVLRSHQVAYYLQTGVDPRPGLVMHSCDNPKCCNPHHLSVGTHVENMQDMATKHRATNGGVATVGQENGNAVLTDTDVLNIRKLIGAGLTNVSIGKQFGVTHATISCIRRKVTWKHLVP